MDLDSCVVARNQNVFGALAGNVNGQLGQPIGGRVVEGASTKAGFNRPIILDGKLSEDENGQALMGMCL